MARNWPSLTLRNLNSVPIIGGTTYVKTGILKWWIGGVLMGGVYMVCGTFCLLRQRLMMLAREVNRPRTKVHGYEITTGWSQKYQV